jgi:retron-type reverse transcriptase
VETLARMLQTPLAELQRVSDNASALYRIGKRKLKKDGTMRLCYDAVRPLKSIQARIQCLILNQVQFPRYLQGGIRDKANPRGQAPNARLHLRKNTQITEDIEKFFPSIYRSVVFDIWHRFFRFPPPVAECLTKLTTKDRYLPQGAKTSSLLANLVFWEHEWALVADLHARGITYTRLIDDITVSSDTVLPRAELSTIIGAIRELCRTKGLRLQRRKQTIARAGNRMITTELVVNTKTSLPPKKRSSIRAAVAGILKAPPQQRQTNAYGRKYRRTAGQVAYLKQHHPSEAASLLAALHTAKPRG